MGANGGRKNKVYALDGMTGSKKWESIVGGEKGILSFPAIGPDGTIYVGSATTGESDGTLYALDGKSGAMLWEFAAGSQLPNPAVASDGTVYVPGYHDGSTKLYALDGRSGRKKWEMEVGTGLNCSAAIDSDGTVYIGSWDGKVYAIR